VFSTFVAAKTHLLMSCDKMSDIIIRVEKLSKLYRLGQIVGYTTLREDLTNVISAPFRRLRRTGGLEPQAAISGHQDYIWALKDISFEVKRGEAVGIIGRNGSGKSTLLKILSRITWPTEGHAQIRGRVGSLLEVGTGFHPELTGRENIYLNGAIIGMKKAEVERKFDEIVAFSEIEKFLDTPVKRYSSGMYVRLAFAVAAHLEPEILLVDEVLAVGDASFQKKCLGKMGNVASEGRTVLFVSHNMAAIQNICTGCVWLDTGAIQQIGATAEVIHAYMDRSGLQAFRGEMDLRDWPNRYGSGEARIQSARLLDEKGSVTTVVRRTGPMTVEFLVESHCRYALHLSAVIVAESGARVLHLAHHDTPGLRPGVLEGRYLIKFVIPSLPLCAGNYSIVLGVHTENLIPVDVVTDVLPFVAEDIVDSPRPYTTVAEYGYCWTPNDWSVTPAAD
jgi:lipopolysaccharide transport system ATP-binding protein